MRVADTSGYEVAPVAVSEVGDLPELALLLAREIRRNPE